jgi:predicted XRE-type DNA-binding protein
MPARKNEPSHVSRGNVFEDLGFTSEEAAVLRVKASLHIEILKAVKRRKLTPRQLERLLDIPQPRVSELLCGKISQMSADRLTKYLYRLGREINVTTRAGTASRSATA